MFAPTEYNPVGSHQRIVLGASARLLPKAGNEATCIIIQAETENIRYRLDGTAPTATTGFQLAAGDRLVIPIVTSGLYVIREAAGAVIQIQWIS